MSPTNCFQQCDFHNVVALKQAADAMEKCQAIARAKRLDLVVSVTWNQLLWKQAEEKQSLIENHCTPHSGCPNISIKRHLRLFKVLKKPSIHR
jgi:hypothetical protein